MDVQMSLIKVHNLCKSYHGKSVLRGLDLEVTKGETVAILGRSGVGKSVLLKQIMGLERPDRGKVEIDGVTINTAGNKALSAILSQMGMLFQGAALFDSLTIFQNTAFPLRHRINPETARSYTQREISDLVEWALGEVDLAHTRNQLPSELSGGMRKRAGLARLLAYKPKIICLDEPTTGLDLLTGGQINDLIVKTQQTLDATIVVVTHDIPSALKIGHRIAFHEEGRISNIVKKEDFATTPSPLVQAFLQTHEVANSR